MSSDGDASTRVRQRERGERYAHERIRRRERGRPVRLASVLLAVGAVALLGVVVGGRTPDRLPLEAFLLDPSPIVVDPTPLLVVAGVVRDASLIVTGLATGIGGCLLCIAALRVRGWQ